MKLADYSAKLKERLLYLLIFLLPVQLGRHFFFDFTRIAGITSDYLAPVIYLTDIVIFILIFLDLRDIFTIKRKKISRLNQKKGGTVILFFLYLILSVMLVSANKWASFYKLLKVGEFFWLFKIIIDLKAKFLPILTVYCLSVVYTSYLAINQFMWQKSSGGIWWSLGERSFYASTPGIALGSFGGRLFLRPYATFAHPNILGGFLAIGLPMVFLYLWKNKEIGRLVKFIFTLAFILGTITLILSFSRASWLVFILGLTIAMFTEVKKVKELIYFLRKWYFFLFIFLFIISIVLPLNLDRARRARRGSLFERSRLIISSLTLIGQNPITGTGLNNSVIKQYQSIPKRYGLVILQPVHNVYLLVLTELGFIGFIFLLIFLKRSFEKIDRENIHLFFPFLMLIILGFFDHYLVTLQQGQLLAVLFTGLVFWPQKA
ncbi:hypothetical protein A2W14_06450 [Candidatus Gottesmanbacteria bacterium RBG_16_37_8]|uniref:O-antigen ligase-related domain-containing protein n=1 Tax=Candidatus Gottesmanbacteria bacterium RBG_16_37_8 TaxID=1798371 RepID=A0A1F5YRQ4_9BACT|nr:MAG: hypothetical protein A2W14_06450 [Candidatus Gottesmanbacteria bacterium RBG_16_37_8]